MSAFSFLMNDARDFELFNKLAAAFFWSALTATVGAAPAFADDAPDRPKTGSLVACVDPYNFPASLKDKEPPGYDVEIMRAVARQMGSQLEYFWSDTGTRGGLGRALRTSILQKKCGLFVGLGVNNDSVDELKEKHLVFTVPYLSQAFVLVDHGTGNEGKTQLADFKNVKIGVSMASPADGYLFDNGFERSVFNGERSVLKALDAGTVEAALVWSPALAYAKRDYPNAKFHVVANSEPESSLRWNLAIAVPEGDTALKQSLDNAIAELLKNGEIKRIVESYGVPFFPPFS